MSYKTRQAGGFCVLDAWQDSLRLAGLDAYIYETRVFWCISIVDVQQKIQNTLQDKTCLVVSTSLNNISQNGNLPQIGVNMKIFETTTQNMCLVWVVVLRFSPTSASTYDILELLLMEKILHQLIGSLSQYAQGFIHPRWCRISSINSLTVHHLIRRFLPAKKSFLLTTNIKTRILHAPLRHSWMNKDVLFLTPL